MSMVIKFAWSGEPEDVECGGKQVFVLSRSTTQRFDSIHPNLSTYSVVIPEENHRPVAATSCNDTGANMSSIAALAAVLRHVYHAYIPRLADTDSLQQPVHTAGARYRHAMKKEGRHFPSPKYSPKRIRVGMQVLHSTFSTNQLRISPSPSRKTIPEHFQPLPLVRV